jgi:hypothetical protein
MTRDQIQLAAWGGGGLVLLIIAGVILSSRAGLLEQVRSEATQLHGQYTTLYPNDGRPSQEALTAAERLQDHQTQALKDAEEKLVAVLPDDYRRTDVNQAGSRLSADLASLKQRAQRQKIAIPQELPFEKGFDAEEGRRSLQLAQLFLYHSAIGLIMDSGITRITNVSMGTGYRDESGTYAVLPCEFVLEGNYEAFVQVVDTLREHHDQGFGIRDIKLTQGPQAVQGTLLITMITICEPVWELPAISGTIVRSGVRGAATPARPESKGRESRLGGQ